MRQRCASGVRSVQASMRSFYSRLALIMLSMAPAFSQQTPPAQSTPPAQPDQTRIHVQVNEVIVPVTVTDEKDRFVSDLDAKDFHIFDEGKLQKIQFFSRERLQPVVVGFLMDLSNTSRLHW